MENGVLSDPAGGLVNVCTYVRSEFSNKNWNWICTYPTTWQFRLLVDTQEKWSHMCTSGQNKTIYNSSVCKGGELETTSKYISTGTPVHILDTPTGWLQPGCIWDKSRGTPTKILYIMLKVKIKQITEEIWREWGYLHFFKTLHLYVMHGRTPWKTPIKLLAGIISEEGNGWGEGRGLKGDLLFCIIWISYKTLFMFSWEDSAEWWAEIRFSKKENQQAEIPHLPDSSSHWKKSHTLHICTQLLSGHSEIPWKLSVRSRNLWFKTLGDGEKEYAD